MKSVLQFAIVVLVGFWAVDQFAFDGEYSSKIWKQGNSYGQDWQREAKEWVRRH